MRRALGAAEGGHCLADRPDEPITLTATFATPRARLDELDGMQSFVQAYHQIERGNREEYIDKTADPALKATAYNLLGDYYRRDPKHQKDALYAYLWVDVIHNQDPIESAKAVSRLAGLFQELRDEERAKKYRDRMRGK